MKMSTTNVLPDCGRWTCLLAGYLNQHHVKLGDVECWGTGALLTVFHLVGYSWPQVATLLVQTQLHRGVSPLSLGKSKPVLGLREMRTALEAAILEKREDVPTMRQLDQIHSGMITFRAMVRDGDQYYPLSITPHSHPHLSCLDAVLFTCNPPLSGGHVEFEGKYYYSPIGLAGSTPESLAVGGKIKTASTAANYYNQLHLTHTNLVVKSQYTWEDDNSKQKTDITWDAQLYLEGIASQ